MWIKIAIIRADLRSVRNIANAMPLATCTHVLFADLLIMLLKNAKIGLRIN